MKNLLLFFVAFISLTAFPVSDIYVAGYNYKVVSDEFNGTIPMGKCLVVGHVYSSAANAWSKVPIINGNVATLDREKSFYTDSTGLYKLLLDVDDTSIFFYDSKYEEIVIWKYNFQSQHVVTIDFYPGYAPESIELPAKPVIYLYSDKKIDTEIQFTCTSNLTFTYPIYNDKWEMTVDESGMTATKTGKKYPYLFWEAEPTDINFQITEKTMNGFLLNSDTIMNFLESSLTKLSLNEKEQTDFITYWAPKLISKPFVLIQFLVDDDYTNYISKISVSPSPDAMRRVFMLFKPLDTNEIGMTIQPQELNSFERNACLSDGQVRQGFTVVEWGGSEMKMSNLIP